MLSFVQESPEVFYAAEAMPTVGPAEISFLKQRAASNLRGRSRLCLHRSPEEPLHEMVIVHHHDSFVRPHRHLGRSESLGVVEGDAALLTYDDGGPILSVTKLAIGPASSTRHYRMPAGVWHSLLITSAWFVFIETTQGPFDRRYTEFPDWAPSGDDTAEATSYMRELAQRASLTWG